VNGGDSASDVAKASFATTDSDGPRRSSTYKSTRTSSSGRGSLIKRGLTIEVPENDTTDLNPDFKTPVEINRHFSEYSTNGKSERGSDYISSSKDE